MTLPPIVGRLAPSPTGNLHVGHARTFLFAWWHARARGGKVVLRIEDLDAPRVIPGAADRIRCDLEWLGLDWDGPVVVQSSRLERMVTAVRDLIDRGLAYPCVCSRADLVTAASAPQMGVAEPRYPGTCRGRFRSIEDAEQRTGKSAGLRFVVPPGDVGFADGVAGQQVSNVADEIGDFLISRKTGAPAYQLAVVVDDAADGVTEVVRGDDLLSSTARQKLLQRALGVASPEWWHVPLVVDEDGRRLAKRADDVSLTELRQRGVEPRALVGWLARQSTVADVDVATAAELTPHFSIDRVSRLELRVPKRTDALVALLGTAR